MRTNLPAGDSHRPLGLYQLTGRTGLCVQCSHGYTVWLTAVGDDGPVCVGAIIREPPHLEACAELRQLVAIASGLGGEA